MFLVGWRVLEVGFGVSDVGDPVPPVGASVGLLVILCARTILKQDTNKEIERGEETLTRKGHPQYAALL